MHESEAVHQKSGKANFESIYGLEDPRGYFRTLGRFDYRIPQHGQRVFSSLMEARRGEGDDGRRTSVVDVCCSYGINAALLKHETTLDDLYARYGSEELGGLSSEELAGADAAFYRERARRAAPEVIGIDVSKNAVAYGLRSGVLDSGFVENLEEDEPTPTLARVVSGADLLTVTGGVGYITGRTFERLLERMANGSGGRVPWVAVFALRWVSYGEVSEVLSRYGLVTEKLTGHTFTQRRFTDASEQEYVLEELARMDVDTSGKEDEGWYHADFYLSRPADEAEAPVRTLLEPAL